METLTPASFKLRFPQFETEKDARIQLFIDDAQPYFNVSLWAGFYLRGLGFFVAHQLFVANMYAKVGTGTTTTQQQAGVVVNKKAGDLQIGYSDGIATKQMDDPFMLSPYGREYLLLRRLIGGSLGALAV